MSRTAREVIAEALPGALTAGDATVYVGKGDALDDYGIVVDGSVSMPAVADAILIALEEAGFVVAPKEPIDAMLPAEGVVIGFRHDADGIEDNIYVDRDEARDVWRAMMEAASPGYTERRNALKKENR